MADDINNYYKNYYDKYGEGSYKLEKVKDTSRIKVIWSWLADTLKPGAKVLDVGCGDGYLAQIMPEYNWTGIDINTSQVKGNAVEHDLMVSPYPLESGSFDAAVCSEVLEHVWDLRIVHKEVNRALKSTGLYLVSTPNFDWLYLQMTSYRDLLFDSGQSHLMEHIRQYNLPVHKKYLESSGFNIFKYTGADAHFDPMFVHLRKLLTDYINNDLQCKNKVTETDIDVILGKGFPTTSHTIMMLARKLHDATN